MPSVVKVGLCRQARPFLWWEELSLMGPGSGETQNGKELEAAFI